MGYLLYDITNPDASYDWLYSVLNIKKGDLISDYILECNKDFDIFFERHLSEVECMDINQLEIVVFHVTMCRDKEKRTQRFEKGPSRENRIKFIFMRERNSI